MDSNNSFKRLVRDIVGPDEITYEPVEQPPLKPLEPGWWEDDTLTSHSDATERALRDGEAQRLQDAEERNY